MSTFIGRKRELKELHDAVHGEKARLIVIKGRRRVGKSRLAEEFARQLKGRPCYKLIGQPPVKGISQQSELDNLASQISQVFGTPKPALDSWETAFWHIADRTRDGRCTLIIDEINWFGKTDNAIAEKLFLAWEQHFKHYPYFTLILSGSLSGWIENHFSNNTAYVGRITLNMTLRELPLDDALKFFGPNRQRLSAHEQLKLLLTTGCIPSYLQEINPKETAENNIKRLFFRDSGLLYNEFDILLNDLFQRKHQRFRQILLALTEQKRSAKDIAIAINTSSNEDLYDDLLTMEQCGFIERLLPWNLNTAKPKVRYQLFRICDNYMRFYLSSVLDQRERIQAGNDRLPTNLSTYLGLQFENLLLKNREIIWEALNISSDDIVKDGSYVQHQTKTIPGCQIDYLIQTRYSVYLIEIKYQLKPLGLGIIEEVQKKARALTPPKNLSIRPVLVHVGGVKDTVIESDYFDKMIDMTKHIDEVH